MHRRDDQPPPGRGDNALSRNFHESAGGAGSLIIRGLGNAGMKHGGRCHKDAMAAWP